MIYDVSDLEVYRVSLKLYKDLKELLRKIPFAGRDIARNCDRAGQSIPANIAEGFAKKSSEGTFKFHLQVSLGSSDEVISHLRTIVIAVPRLTEEAKKLAKEYKILSSFSSIPILLLQHYQDHFPFSQ